MDADKVVEIEIKSVYGVERIYPRNRTAQLLADLTGQKTFTHDKLRMVRELGYTLKVTPYQLVIQSEYQL